MTAADIDGFFQRGYDHGQAATPIAFLASDGDHYALGCFNAGYTAGSTDRLRGVKPTDEALADAYRTFLTRLGAHA